MVTVDADTIVVGIDGSPCSEDALQWAIMEAQRSGRRLLLVHAWHWASDVATTAGASDGRKVARSLLYHAASQAGLHGVGARTRLVEGSPVGSLVGIATGAAMLVVGSHGHRTLTKAILGSVSKDCVQHGPCPVVVVPARKGAQPRREPASLVKT